LRLASIEKYSDFTIDGVAGEDRSGIRQRFFDLGISFKLPVMDNFSNLIKSLNAKKNSMESNYKNEKKIFTTNFKSIYTEFEYSKKNLLNFPIPLSIELEKKLKYSDDEFKKGRITINSYMDLENQLHELHHLIYDSQSVYVEKYIQILILQNTSDLDWENNN